MQSMVVVWYAIFYGDQRCMPERMPGLLRKFKFGDIALKVVDDSLSARISISQHGEPKEFLVYQNRSGNAGESTLDPLNLLVIHALCMGAIEVTSVEECYTNASMNNSMIVWKYKELHVFPHESQLAALDLARPASIAADRTSSDPRETTTIQYAADTVDVRTLKPELLLGSRPFINRFFRINELRKERGQNIAPATGGSRDPPTRFQFLCPNKSIGCTKRASSPWEIQRHLLMVCNFKTPELMVATRAKELEKVHPCSTCGTAFSSKKYLDDHYRRQHGHFAPRKCERCTSQTIYQDWVSWRKHLKNGHSNWIPVDCGIEGCHTKRKFQDRAAFHFHIRTRHPTVSRDDRIRHVNNRLAEARRQVGNAQLD